MSIAVGAPANVVLLDPAATRTIDPAAMATSGRNSPFRGRVLPGRVVATFLRGHPTVLDGALAEPAPELEEVPA
jgi:dihydroorotase